jgi:hypothetical protein
MSAAKPFAIDKWRVYDAYQAVKNSRISSCTGNAGWWVRLLDGSGVNREVHAPF